MTPPFFIKSINCRNRVQSVLKSHEKCLAQKQNFRNCRRYELGHMKIELINQDK